jgi:site-specific recombinase XerD
MNPFLLFSQPTIGGVEKGRPYVYFSHVLSKRKYRYYSGVAFGMRSARGLKDEELHLYFRSLAQTITMKLSTGWKPEDESSPENAIERDNKPLKDYDAVLRAYIDKADYGIKHKYSLRWYWGELLKQFSKTAITDIQESDITTHLMNRYASSNTSYNTAKRYYKCIFNLLVQLGYLEVNPVVGIKNRKAEASINEAFEKEELKKLMDYLKLNDRVLYRVVLLMYTTFMRPHQEIRLLQVKFFRLDERLLLLPPRFTKNGKQATIPIQETVVEEFSFLRDMDPDAFVFGITNPFYFSTRWGKKIKKNYRLKPNQTLYSVRHTAAVEMYRKTKDVALIQRMMHHSSMEVTIGYLRSLNCNLAVVNADMYPSL